MQPGELVALAVHDDAEAWPASRSRARGAPRTRTRASPFTSLASLAIRLASESNPKLATPMYGVALDVRHVDEALLALDSEPRRLAGVGRDAQHAGEVVAAAAGDDGQRAVRALERAGEGAQQPVAAERRRPSRRSAAPTASS